MSPLGGGRRSSLESGESGGTTGRGRGLRGGGTHQGSVLAGVGAGKAAGEVTRWRRATPVAGTSAPAGEVERLPAGTHAARGAQVVLGQGLGASLGCASALEGQLDDDGVPGGAATACVSEGHDERLVL
jgi:hypothetical protein